MKSNTNFKNFTIPSQQRRDGCCNNRGSELLSRGLPRVALCASLLGIGLGFASNAQAHCTLLHPDHCVKEGVNAVGNTADKNIIKPIEGIGQNVGNFTTQQAKNAGDLAKKGLDESSKAVVGFVKGPLVKEGEAHWNEIKGKMEGIGKAFKTVSSTSDFQALALAVARQDSAGIVRALPRVLYPVFVQTDKDQTWSEFEKMIKEGKIGTLLLGWSGGLSLGVGVDVDVGIAIDIAYVQFARQQYTLAPNNPFTSLPFQGSIGSIFTAAGGSIGFSAGGSSDFVFGYHAAPPTGIGGPGFCLGLQVKVGGGTGVDVCWDISGLPWKIVTAGIAFGVGAEVDASGGANYTVVVAKVCSGGSFGGTTVTCPGEGTTPATTTTATTVTPALANALDCVSRYAQANTCDWNHWSEMYTACKTASVPELHNNNFLLNKVKGGQCTWNNWTNLYNEAIGKTSASGSNDLSGTYRIRVKATNTFWHEDGCCSKLVSTRWQPNDDYTQFILEKQSDGSYRIKVKADNRYLHVDSSSDKILSTRYQVNDDYTRFFFEKQSDGSYRIKLKATNRYLHHDGNVDKMVSTRYQVNDDFTRFFLDAGL